METIEAIRDFFLADDAVKLELSFLQLNTTLQEASPLVDDWQEVEFAFNRLFVGPAALEAPPFSSVYLDAQGQVMSQTTLDVRQMYRALGLESPWKNSLPDDHISLELDAALALNYLVKEVDDEVVRELHAHFMMHMEKWVPQFIELVLSAPSSHPVINHVVICLSNWLQKKTKQSKEQSA
ncbi:MAG: molecular chaperone TorD family protein [Desulfopila sp.]|jgi:TorA maturation chaperone TorD|nr:molecular chaperone TorD family protein [Desulfopila sp.]